MQRRTLLMLPIGFVVGVTPTLAARYVAPPRGRLMLDAVLTNAALAGARLPIYLDKTGRYYLELYVEGVDATAAVVAATTPLSFHLLFSQRERVLHEAAVDVVLAPGERHCTLGWIEAPGQLPARRELALVVTLRAWPSTLAGMALRLQITRKLELPPLVPR
ncbi:MAG: hypothetical protein IT493_12055 [Gammaproteobacteria bacterium]|nr:hypothetical protein [Gammaproteobacteria bacterium]